MWSKALDLGSNPKGSNPTVVKEYASYVEVMCNTILISQRFPPILNIEYRPQVIRKATYL